jgi:hypothetical protein
MLYALLSHVTTDDPSREFLAAYKVLAKIDFTKYRSFADYLRTPVLTSSTDILSAIYWNGNEALILFANLSDQDASFRWELDASRIGWEQTGVPMERSGTLAPLSFQYLRVPRQSQATVSPSAVQQTAKA